MNRYCFFALLLVFPLSGTLHIESIPTTVIEGPGSGIDHAEGLAFTPDGSLLAVANFNSNSITFYRRIEGECACYETSPCYVLEGSDSGLGKPHDLSFSPDGNLLAVANRNSHTITVYQKRSSDGFFNTAPISQIGGSKSGLSAPTAVAFSPIHDLIVVGNNKTNSLTFFHHSFGVFAEEPYFTITRTSPPFRTPDGLGFSPNGECLAVTSHGTHRVHFFTIDHNSPDQYLLTAIGTLGEENGCFTYPHSVAFHPSNNYIAISNAGGKHSILLFEREKDSSHFSNTPLATLTTYNPETIHLQEVYQQEGGAKGLAFSPDGTCLAVCISDIPHPDRAVMIFQVRQ